RHGPRIVHAMALKDPARAERVADRMRNFPDELQKLSFHHAYALGMIALATADTDKAGARERIDAAFSELAALAKEGRQAFANREDAASVAAALLPVVERIDPGLVPEYFWRAASWRGRLPTSLA